MGDFLLVLHVGVGTASLVVCAGAGYAVFKGKKERYSMLIKLIGGLAGVSVLSGVGLALFQATQEGIYSLCVRLVLYLIVVGSVEGALWVKLRKAAFTG